MTEKPTGNYSKTALYIIGGLAFMAALVFAFNSIGLKSMVETMKPLVEFLTPYMAFPERASEHSLKMDAMMVAVHLLMLVLFVGWSAYFIYVLIRFRESKHPKADYLGAQNKRFTTLAEFGVIAAEIVLIACFAVPLWAEVVVAEKFPQKSDNPVIVRVVAQQFGWNVRYQGKDETFGKQDVRFISPENKFGYSPTDNAGNDDVVPPFNSMTVPTGRPVIIYLSSTDVIHSYKVVPLRICQDAIPGLVIPMHFKANKPGNYMITCAQLCGDGHAKMRGFLNVVSPSEFDKWLLDSAPKPKTTNAPPINLE